MAPSESSRIYRFQCKGITSVVFLPCRSSSARLALSLGTAVAVLGDDVAPDSDRETVGHSANNRDVTPVNQVLTPFGLQVDLPKMRPQGIALSPDRSLLVVSGKTSELVVLNPQDGSIRQRVHLPNDSQTDPRSDPVSSHILKPDRDGQLSFTGLIFSPSGDRIYMSNVEGSIKVFSVATSGAVSPSHSFVLPPANAPRRKAEIPSGLAVTADGKRLYVCGNLSNRLLELDTTTGRCAAAVRCGSRAVRRRARGRESFCQQLGRPPARPQRSYRSRGAGNQCPSRFARHR